MWRLEKRFSLPIGHRLSKHPRRCASIHGHNVDIIITVKSEKLNENDMVIDFSDLKKIVNDVIDKWDHCLLLNKCDSELAEILTNQDMRVITFDFDPTAEKLAETLFEVISTKLLFETKDPNIQLDSITIYENENSLVTYDRN